jgi:xanthine dehydrogenase accessory factor
MTDMTNINWLNAVNQLSGNGEAYVLVTVLGVKGSSPRDSGTKMVVTKDNFYASIGGGHLEYKTIHLARQLLKNEKNEQHVEHFALGPNLGQCCGGSTSVLFECFGARQVNIMLFGAGHVGRALAQILGDLPCRLSWVDSREEQIPPHLPDNTSFVLSDVPVDEVSTMPSNSYYIVMTHNHQLDFDICAGILKLDDFSYLGLIGSSTKWARFQRRLQHHGYSKDLISRITCPVGLSEVPGKQPMEVAVSVASEIIQHYQARQPKLATQQGVPWQQLRALKPGSKQK